MRKIAKTLLAFICIVLVCAISLAEDLSYKFIDIQRKDNLPYITPKGANQIEISTTRYAVDFADLKSYAPNAVAYLFQRNITINQPIVSSDSKDFYLNHSYNGGSSSIGTLFVEKGSKFSDEVTYIYGRNNSESNNILFSSLHLYKDPNYYRQHPSLYLLTPEGDYKLDIFAGIKERNSLKANMPTTLQETLKNIGENSFIKPYAKCLPKSDDSIAVLVSENLQGIGNRYLIYARKRPIAYKDCSLQLVNKAEMDEKRTQNKFVSYKGLKNVVLYAQNDELWARSKFESVNSKKRRPFRDGGCGPTSVANALANILDKKDLIKLKKIAKNENGFVFCNGSVNETFCKERYRQYSIESEDEFLRYLPMAIAGISTGNNIWGLYGRTSEYGSNLIYLSKLCDTLGITIEKAKSREDAIKAIRADKTVAISTVRGRPFTRGSHFLLLLGADDEYVYVIDSFRRDNYDEFNAQDILNVVTPGLLAIKHEDVEKCGFMSIYILQKK